MLRITSLFILMPTFLLALIGCSSSEEYNPCSGVTCGGVGTCQFNRSIIFCVCDDGYHSVGLSCVSDEAERDADGDEAERDADSDEEGDSDLEEEPCTPTTCAEEGVECGEIDDGCDGFLECGPGCDNDETCRDGTCVPGLWVTIDAGTFDMGSPDDEEDRVDDEIQHEVTLTRGFELQTTEVTQAQFLEVMGYNPSFFGGCADCPVERVNWYEAAAYCNALSELVGLDLCYECSVSDLELECEPSSAFPSPYDCPGYRLPTEAEWEYAARSGTTGARYGDVDDVGWHSGNSGGRPQSVGTKDASRWGLYDMLGNVWEWCHDWYGGYPSGSVTDPWGPVTGYDRVLRGGCWDNPARFLRAAQRDWLFAGFRDRSDGFRVAASLASP